MFVLNVIGKGAEPALFSGLGSGAAQILSPGHAFDLPVVGIAALIAARDIATDLPLDVNLVATAHRRKKLLIADMDSTIINVECLDELADMAGLKPQIAASPNAPCAVNWNSKARSKNASACSRA